MFYFEKIFHAYKILQSIINSIRRTTPWQGFHVKNL